MDSMTFKHNILKKLTLTTILWLSVMLVSSACLCAVKDTPSSTKSSSANGSSPIIQAAASGNISLVKSIIEKGADVNAVDKEGATPLTVALSNGHAETVKYLLSQCAKAGKPNIDSASPRGFIFPKPPLPAKTILHVNLLNASSETRLAVTVLQGLVN